MFSHENTEQKNIKSKNDESTCANKPLLPYMSFIFFPPELDRLNNRVCTLNNISQLGHVSFYLELLFNMARLSFYGHQNIVYTSAPFCYMFYIIYDIIKNLQEKKHSSSIIVEI